MVSLEVVREQSLLLHNGSSDSLFFRLSGNLFLAKELHEGEGEESHDGGAASGLNGDDCVFNGFNLLDDVARHEGCHDNPVEDEVSNSSDGKRSASNAKQKANRFACKCKSIDEIARKSEENNNKEDSNGEGPDITIWSVLSLIYNGEFALRALGWLETFFD